mgnify:CR=1 FL=1
MELFSEPFSSTGNMAAEGSKKLLGKPALGLLQTVLRESLQNSIDAAKGAVGPEIRIRLRNLTSEEHRNLSERVFCSLPEDESSHAAIRRSLDHCPMRVLEICDFNTSGLGGPLRADEPVWEEDPDFVNFLRNIGAAQTTHQGGGTYGYGKTSLYAISQCATILVDTMSTAYGETVRRFMGCHLGSTFDGQAKGDTSPRRYTGRHWWGKVETKGGVDPVTGEAAGEIAAALGLPERGEAGYGTSIMIIDPAFDSEGVDALQSEIIESILWNFWPRMSEATPAERYLSIELEVMDRPVTIPAPEEYPPLDLYAGALADIRNGEDRVRSIACGRPRKHLGQLAIRNGMCAKRHSSAKREEHLVPDQSHHIALMRPVELVVKYMPGEPFPDRHFEWGGVFICSDEREVETAFAASEPPAHDDWMPDNLRKGSQRTFVNVGLRELRSRANEYVQPAGAFDDEAPGGPSLARTASRMGSLLGQTESRGPGRGGGGGGTSKGPYSVSSPVFERLEMGEDGNAYALFSATVRNDGSNPDLRLVAEPQLVADSGPVSTSHLSSEFLPSVSTITHLRTEKSEQGNQMELGGEDGDVEFIVSVPGITAVGLKLRLEKGAP